MAENSEGTGRLTKTVSQRFEKAKIEQQKRENERIESFRQLDVTKRNSARKSLAGRWEEVLSESKVDEKNKFEIQKKATIASFLSAYEAGLVQKRISHFESLVMQRATSAEKILATIKASFGIHHSNRSIVETTSSGYSQDGSDNYSNNNNGNNNNQDNHDNQSTVSIHSIPFYCGSTQTYNFSHTSPLCSLLFDCLMANSKEPLPLLCGIYSTQQNEIQTLEIIAVAMLDETMENYEEPYIAITINIIPGHEHDHDIYGIKKIAFFVSSGGEESDDKTLLWDAVFNLLPELQTIDSNETTVNNVNNVNNAEKTNESCQESENQQTTTKTLTNTTSSNLETMKVSDSHQNEKSELNDIPAFSRHEFDILSQEGDGIIAHGRGIGNYVSSSDSSVDEGDQTWKEVIPEAEKNSAGSIEIEVSDTGTIFSLAKAKGMPEVRQSSMIPPLDNLQSQKKYSDLDQIPWTLQDTKVPESCEIRSTQVDFNVREILSSSCSNESLVIRLKSGVSVIILNNMKNHLNTSNYVVTNGLVFEWVRGIAKSGWLHKWPMKNQKAGMMTRRFFILRDRILSYHRVEPSSQEDASADYSMHSIKLKKGHLVQKSRHHMRSCVKLDTLSDVLWVRCNSQEDEDDWIAAIWEGISRYSRLSPFFWKTRVEMIWHHESPTFQCIGVDAVANGGKYWRAALYCSSSTLSQSNPIKRVSRTNSFGPSKKDFLPGDDAIYSLEYGTSIDNEVHLEVLSLTSATESPRLLCLKILGDVIMIGGTNGYIGIAVVGAPARYRLEIPYSKKLSESGICEVICRQFEGHQSESHVLKIISDEELSLFVSGDSLGGVALWKQRKRTGIAFIGSLKGRSLNGSRITDIVFTPTKTHLIIGTIKKLLLVGLCSANDGSYRMEGLNEIETCDSSLCCYYSFSFTSILHENQETNQKDALIVWKIVSESFDCADSMSRSSVESDLLSKPTHIYRYLLKNEILQQAAINLQPIIRYREQEKTTPEKQPSFAPVSTEMMMSPPPPPTTTTTVQTILTSPSETSSVISPQKIFPETKERRESNTSIESTPTKSSWRGAAKRLSSGSKIE